MVGRLYFITPADKIVREGTVICKLDHFPLLHLSVLEVGKVGVD